MAFEIRSRWLLVPSLWLTGCLVTAILTGCLYACGHNLWILCILCAAFCAFKTIGSLQSLYRRVRYVMEATVNGDFSYSFPTDRVGKEDSDINSMLNEMVAHFEHLSAEARRNETFLKGVFNITETGLAVVDAGGNVILHNEAMLRLLNRTALTHVCQIPEDNFPGLKIQMSEHTVRERSFRLISVNDNRRQMQAVEVESWERLTRVLTHEIMNSLTPVHSIAATMEKRLSAEGPEKEAFGIISSSCGSLMGFVKNFREFTKLPAPHARVVFLRGVLESCARMCESYVADKAVAIEVRCFPPELMVYTDESLLSRVLLNILKNAVEANPKSIVIEGCEMADESVEIRISNDGDLIPDEIANDIFTPFFTTRASGSGIGLSLSRRIVSHLGGILSLKTRPVTCFSVRL